MYSVLFSCNFAPPLISLQTAAPNNTALNGATFHTSFKTRHYKLCISISKSLWSVKHSSSIKRYAPPPSKYKFITKHVLANISHCPGK
jgi:hypothetical protein